MNRRTIHILATGGTIAGSGSSPTAQDYRPGELAFAPFLEEARALMPDASITGSEVAAIGSQDIGADEWHVLHRRIRGLMDDPDCRAIVVTHGTDTVEETAFLLDLTLPGGPGAVPVILVGAMRPASAVGSDGLRNLANALRVAGDPHAAGRGVLVVMDDSIFSARDVRKARTQGTQAFRSFPRGPVGSVTPANLEWFGGPWRDAGTARFDLPEVLPNVPIIHAAAGMDAGMVHALEDAGAQGFVLAGMGNGNAPRAVLDALAASVQRGLPVVRSTRSDQGLVERNIEVDDDACGFIAARALNPAKARILLQLLIAHHRDTPELAQAAFDTR